jgi:peptidyl-prolyl cis-trans isomerase C
MHHSRALLAAALLPVLAACAPKTATEAPINLNLGTGTAVATVNGTTISQDFFDYYIKRLTGKTSADLTPQQRSEVLDNLIRAELLAQQAVPKEGIDADTRQLLKLAQMQVLEQIASEKVPKPTEQEMREAYEKAMTGAPKVEYHARHILLETEQFAQKIIERLDKGEKFQDLAKLESADPASKDNGGDLPWFKATDVDPALAQAVSSLKPGAYTHVPVHTNYGWHVIELVETRDAAAPPTFEAVRPQLQQILQQRKLKAYTDDLLRTARIEKKLGTDAAAKTGSSSSASTSATSASGPAKP